MMDCEQAAETIQFIGVCLVFIALFVSIAYSSRYM